MKYCLRLPVIYNERFIPVYKLCTAKSSSLRSRLYTMIHHIVMYTIIHHIVMYINMIIKVIVVIVEILLNCFFGYKIKTTVFVLQG